MFIIGRIQSRLAWSCANSVRVCSSTTIYLARSLPTFVRRGHQPSLPSSLQRAGSAILAALAAQPFDPPSRKQLAPDAPSREALRFLSETGEVLSLAEDLIMSATAFSQMKTQVQEYLRVRGAATTSELRQALGTSRRVMIPFLEHLDRTGLTMREGDRRVLRAPPKTR